MSLDLVVNGQKRDFEELNPGVQLDQIVLAMGLKGDRVAVERNGEIISRADWSHTSLEAGDRLEVVHFVGGGTC